jgi:hypothetical protein
LAVRGIYFSVDALLAITILALGIFAIHQLSPSEKNIEQQYSISNDFLDIMSVLKISEVNSSYVQELINNGTIDDANATVLQQVGAFWAQDQNELAENLLDEIFSGLVPDNFGYGIVIGNETIYSSGGSGSNLISSNRIVSGITKYKPVEGFMSRLYLTSVDEKLINSYYYFGGYVGDGNLSCRIELPSSYHNVTEVYLELAVNKSFDLYVNGDYSGNFNPQYSDDMRASKWYMNESDYDNFVGGLNTLELNFGDELGYLGGGYIRVDTMSNQTNFTTTDYDGENATKREYLPGIDGILNLYSAFYVPGNLSSLKFHLHFKSEDETFFTVGNTDVYDDNPNGETAMDLTDANLTSLNYSGLSRKTVPIRFRLFGSDFLGPGVDSFLVTDVSGSMDDCSGIYYNATICKYQYCTFYFYGCWNWAWTECEYAGTCSDDECNSGTSRTRNHEVTNGSLCMSKLGVAQDAGETFVDIILNNSNNKIGLTSYEANLDDFTELTNNQNLLKSDINNYTAGGGTCICCGIYKAADLLPGYRDEFMVVISDGDANYKCSGPGDYTGTYDTANAPQSAINAGQYACSNDITVYTIGFGEGISEQGTQTLKQIACNESLYYNATDTSMLEEIITNISNQILKTSFELQTAFSGYRNSTLYNDSYIEYTYDPISPPTVFGKIPFTIEGLAFGNNISEGFIDVIENITVIDAKVTSYSGNKWTRDLHIENDAFDTTVFNLSDYGDYYINLGDPFGVNIPVNYIREGANNLTIKTGTSLMNETGGSPDDRAIYTILVKNSFGYSAVGSYAEGCTWTLQYEDSTNGTVKIPSSYSGNKTCDFQSGSYDSDDALDVAAYYILSYFDFDRDDLIDISIGENSLKTEQVVMTGVPSLWGPSLVEMRIRQ